MDGWMAGWMSRWMGGWRDGYIYIFMNEWILDGWING
jgi:hypothetical protein